MNITSERDRQRRTDLLLEVTIVLIVFFIALRVPFDTDFFWHLEAGKLTVEQHRPLLIDAFSFTKNGAAWVNHSWLSQVIFYLIYKFFSFPGIMILVAVVTTSTMNLIFKSMKGNTFLRVILIVLAVLISAVVWSPRPQIFSLLCFAILCRWINKFDETCNKKYLFLVVALFLLWSNLHAGFSIGIVYIVLFAGGKLLDLIFSREVSKTEKEKLLLLLLLVLACSLAVCINPNGLNVWKVQFDTVSVRSLQNQIDEWASPDFHVLAEQPYLWIWLLFAFFVSMTKQEMAFQKIFPIIFFGGLGFLSKRNYAPFAVIVFPMLSSLIELFYEQRIKPLPIFSRIKSSSSTLNRTPRPIVQKGINLFLVALLGLAVVIKIAYLGNSLVLKTYETKLFPAQALAYLEKEGVPPGNMLNSYAWGGYIYWKNPAIPVFVDGRTDLFGDAIIQDWITLVSANTGYEDLLRKYKIGWVFLEKGNPILDELIRIGWKIDYQDQNSVIVSK